MRPVRLDDRARIGREYVIVPFDGGSADGRSFPSTVDAWGRV
jgi:hypothetical protein